MWISICAAQLLVRTASTFLFTALCTTPHFDVKPTCHLKHTRGFQHHQLAANCPFGAVQVSSPFSSSSEGKTWPLWLKTRRRDAGVKPKQSYLSLLVDDGHRVLQFDVVEQTGQEDIGHTDQAVILLLIEKGVGTFEIGAHHLDRGKRKQELVRTYNPSSTQTSAYRCTNHRERKPLNMRLDELQIKTPTCSYPRSSSGGAPVSFHSNKLSERFAPLSCLHQA